MSTPASAASVETSSAPAGVTCCQRMSPFIRAVHAAVAPAGAAGAGARVAGWAAAGQQTTSGAKNRSAQRADATVMAILSLPLQGGGTAGPHIPPVQAETQEGDVLLRLV